MRKLHRDLVRQPEGEFPIHTITITSTHNARVVHCKVNHEPPRGGAGIEMVPLIKQEELRSLKLKLKFTENYERPESERAGRARIYVQLHQAPGSLAA